MEELFEFLFGASGRINRAKYWLSLLKYTIAGLLAAVILFTAAGIAAPLFIIMVVFLFIPWLMWGFAITTERLHDRDKSAWWLLVFYGVPAVLGQLAKAAWFPGPAGTALHYIRAMDLQLRSGIVERASYGTAGSKSMSQPARRMAAAISRPTRQIKYRRPQNEKARSRQPPRGSSSQSSGTSVQ